MEVGPDTHVPLNIRLFTVVSWGADWISHKALWSGPTLRYRNYFPPPGFPSHVPTICSAIASYWRPRLLDTLFYKSIFEDPSQMSSPSRGHLHFFHPLLDTILLSFTLSLNLSDNTYYILPQIRAILMHTFYFILFTFPIIIANTYSTSRCLGIVRALRLY